MFKKNKGRECICFSIFDDWFYLLLIVIIGIALTMVNLGWLEKDWLSFWPILLIIIGIKEFIERN